MQKQKRLIREREVEEKAARIKSWMHKKISEVLLIQRCFFFSLVLKLQVVQYTYLNVLVRSFSWGSTLITYM